MTAGSHHTRANRLAGETSPYLLQHAHNPVDWYPWGAEALELALRTDRPILLSIGYSACHWCHVMERESFENTQTAQIMNELFVNIKVDREERPDLDSIYMQAVQSLTGHGGWPMTVFLLPDGTPFYGGTYFPPTARQGMPAFGDVLRRVAHAYRSQRDDVVQGGNSLREMITAPVLWPHPEALNRDILNQALEAFAKTFDPQHGGFGGAPKFPQPPTLDALLHIGKATGDPRAHAMVRTTLDRMAHGGIQDHVGGGFHRYAVDAIWLVPHFEKMLYDNAQLASVYLAAWQITGDDHYRRVCRDILDYVRREMTADGGGFFAAQDADSEGVEGKFFVWTPDEVVHVLGVEDARIVCAWFDVTARGNFEHANIFNTPRPPEMIAADLGITTEELRETIDRVRPILYRARANRVAPATDDKIITAWNGLMIRAFAQAGAILQQSAYIDTARRAASYLLHNLVASGAEDDLLGELRLFRTARAGRAHINAFLEDYASLGVGLLALHEATGEARWLATARACGASIMARFRDPIHGGFYDTGSDHEVLVARPKDLYDNAVPSGTSLACDLLLRLESITGDRAGGDVVRDLLSRVVKPLTTHPGAFGTLLGALDFATAKPTQIALIGTREDPQAGKLMAEVHRVWDPIRVLAVARGDEPELMPGVALCENRPARSGQPTAYVCEGFMCQMPTNDPAELARQLGG